MLSATDRVAAAAKGVGWHLSYVASAVFYEFEHALGAIPETVGAFVGTVDEAFPRLKFANAVEAVSVMSMAEGGPNFSAPLFPRLSLRALRLGATGEKMLASSLEEAVVPSWKVTAESQAGWRGLRLGGASSQELALWEDVLKAQEIGLGRSVNVTGRGMFVLDPWLEARGIQWTQRWQDVYNRALFDRLSIAGRPVNVMAGGGYTLGEVTAAEAGARSAGLLNRPYWPGP
jgi:hypothetical protein